MEISLRSVAKSSTASGEAFGPGDRVESFLCRGESGEIERADLRPSEVPGWTAPGPLLCRWTHRIREDRDEGLDARRSALQTAEELFFALHEAESGAETTEDPRAAMDRRVLLTLLALLLERKRVLRVRGRGGLYWHPAGKREFRITPVELTPEMLLAVQDQLAALT